MYTPHIVSKIVYCLALLNFIKSISIPHLKYSYILFNKMFKQFEIIDPFVAILFALIGVVTIVIVCHRIYQIARLEVTLSCPDVSQFASLMRIVAWICMYFGLLAIVAVLIFSLFSGNSPATLVRFLTPLMLIGLVLFEFARIKGFEDDELYEYEYEDEE